MFGMSSRDWDYTRRLEPMPIIAKGKCHYPFWEVIDVR